MIQGLVFMLLVGVGGFLFLLAMLVAGLFKLVGMALGGAFGLARALAILGLVAIAFVFKGVLLIMLLAAGAGLLVYGALRLISGGRRGAGRVGYGRMESGGYRRMDSGHMGYSRQPADFTADGRPIIDVGRSAAAAAPDRMPTDEWEALLARRLRRMEGRMGNLETICDKD